MRGGTITIQEIISQLGIPITITLPEDSSRVTVNFINNSSFTVNFTSGDVANKTLSVIQYTSIADSFPNVQDFNNCLYYYNISLNDTNFIAELTFGYSEFLLYLKGINEDSLAVSFYDSTDSRGFVWQSVPVEIDKENNTIKVTTSHFSLWAITSKNENLIVGVPDEEKAVPNNFKLYQNYPNPFNPETTIRYALPVKATVSIKIYEITGKLVRELDSGQKQAGEHTVKWDGLNIEGVRVASGIYLYRLEAVSPDGTVTTLTNKMTLIR